MEDSNMPKSGCFEVPPMSGCYEIPAAEYFTFKEDPIVSTSLTITIGKGVDVLSSLYRYTSKCNIDVTVNHSEDIGCLFWKKTRYYLTVKGKYSDICDFERDLRIAMYKYNSSFYE